MRRRGRSVGPGRLSLAALLAGFGLLLVGPFFLPAAIFVAVVPGALLVALAGGPRFVRLRGRRLARREGAGDLLAGRRLEAEPQSPGRVAGVLLICGMALGLDAGLVAGIGAGADANQYDLTFYLTGTGLAGAAILVAAGVAVLTLLVGAADQLLDGRRPLASLAALGTNEAEIAGVLGRQLSAVAVPAVVVGVVVGGLAGLVRLSGFFDPAVLLALTVLLAALAGGAVRLVTRLVVRLLRPALRAAIAPENLRVA